MKHFPLQFMILCTTLACVLPALAGDLGFSFGVFPYPAQAAQNATMLREILDETDDDNLAFVVANGIKSHDEPCTDNLYQRAKTALDDAQNGVIVSLTASDWADCRNDHGKASAVAKLNRLRDLFFANEFSLGATKIPLTRQATAMKYRTFVENARWEIGGIMFATINLPANNNHYVFDAGRNSEFEDRHVANRNWLNRVFTVASREKSDAIVLFCDADPLATKPVNPVRRDGYAEIRKQILAQAADFKGKILIIHRQGDKSGDPAVKWSGNLGRLGISAGWARIIVDHGRPALFSVDHRAYQGVNQDAIRPQNRKSEGVALR